MIQKIFWVLVVSIISVHASEQSLIKTKIKNESSLLRIVPLNRYFSRDVWEKHVFPYITVPSIAPNMGAIQLQHPIMAFNPFIPPYVVHSVYNHSGSTIATCDGSDPNIYLWCSVTGKQKKILKYESPMQLYFSFDDNYLVALSMSDKIGIFNLKTDLIKEYAPYAHHIRALALPKHGRFIALGCYLEVLLMCSSTGKEIKRIDISHELKRNYFKWINYLTFDNTDSRLFVLCADGSCRIWSIETGILIKRITRPEIDPLISTLSTDARRYAFSESEVTAIGAVGCCASAETEVDQKKSIITVIQTESEKEIMKLDFIDDVHQLQFDRNSTLLGAYGEEWHGRPCGLLRIWDLTSGHAIFELFNEEYNDFKFHPDGNNIATTTKEQCIKVWDLSALTHPLTMEQVIFLWLLTKQKNEQQKNRKICLKELAKKYAVDHQDLRRAVLTISNVQLRKAIINNYRLKEFMTQPEIQAGAKKYDAIAVTDIA